MVYADARVRVDAQNAAAIRDGGERILAGQSPGDQSASIRGSMSKCIFNRI